MSHHHTDPFKLHHPEFDRLNKGLDRRNFFIKTSLGIGAMALSSLLGKSVLGDFANTLANQSTSETLEQEILKALPHFAPKAKRIVYLFMSGGPSQFETFDYKPKLVDLFGQELPDSIRKGQRLTGMSGSQSTLPVVPSIFKFNQHGHSRTWVSELLPYTAQVVDDLCIIKSIHSEAINHDPALTFFQTGNQLPGRASIGSWISYGLGSDNSNLPSFIVLVSKNASKDQPLYARLWGNGFLPSEHQGVQFRAGKDPVLFLDNPEGYEGNDRKEMLDYLSKLNKLQMMPTVTLRSMLVLRNMKWPTECKPLYLM